jgi:phospho-N-acetylmuramoyl-pentapeptide-transferase
MFTTHNVIFLKNIHATKTVLMSLLAIAASIIILYLIRQHKNLFISQKGRLFLDMGEHATKYVIPSMGGLSFIPLTIIFIVYYQKGIFITLCALLSGLIGGIDDWIKLKYGSGLQVKMKFMMQMIAACIPGIYYYVVYGKELAYIGMLGFKWHISFFIIGWIAWIIMSTTHAVNLTDGIDGLAITLSIITFLTINFFVPNPSSIFILTILTIFFLNNTYPAKIFMGDIGAFFLGGMLAGLFMSEKLELLLPFAGLAFVLTTLSVIGQYAWYKIFKRRLFLFAPYHHSLEKKGWSENIITITYSIIQIFGSLIAYILYVTYYIKT